MASIYRVLSTTTFVGLLCGVASLARAQVYQAPPEPALELGPWGEPELVPESVPEPEPESAPGPPRFWVAADLTYAQGARAPSLSQFRVARLSLDARARVGARIEVGLRWAVAYGERFDRPTRDGNIMGNPGLALTYRQTLPSVDLRLGGELVAGLSGEHGDSDGDHARAVLRSIDGGAEGWRFVVDGTTLVLEVALTSRSGPVRIGAHAAWAMFMGPTATLFAAVQVGPIELGLRVAGGSLETVRGVALTPYVRLERSRFFAELRGTYANVGDIVWSTGVGGGAHF